MLPADFNQLFQLLKNASFAVKRLSAKRNAPNDYRKAVELLNWKTQPIILDEILVLRNAAVQLVMALNDNDIKNGWVGPVSWQTVYRHATNALGWLDKFQKDITEYVETQNPKLARSVEQYERYKLTMINSIDDVFGQLTRVPRLETVPYWRKTAASLLINLSMGIAGLTGCSTHVYAEEPKQTEVKKDVDISDFTDELADKLMAKYKTPKDVFLDKEFVGDTKIEYITEKDGKSNFKDTFKDAKEDACLYVLVPLSLEKVDASVRLTIAAVYSAKKFNLPVKVYDSESKLFKDDMEDLMKQFGGYMGKTAALLATKFDVVKGETKEKNDGKMKVVDVVYGGPAENKYIKLRVRDFVKYLIPTNITDPNKKFAWRTLNSKAADEAAWTKVEYVKK